MAAALVAAGYVGTIVTVAAYAEYALYVYGLYSAYRSSRKAKAAYEASFKDRKVSITSTDMPRAAVYGKRVVAGSIKYIVEARDDPESADDAAREGHPPRPANPYFYCVLALEPGHEVESIETLLFNGQDIGPFVGNPNTNEGGSGYTVAPTSKYYKSTTGVAIWAGLVDAYGTIAAPEGQAITRVLSLVVSQSQTPPNNMTVGSNPAYVIPDPIYPAPSYAISLGQVQVDAALANHGFVITYEYAINQPMVRVWFYRGRDPNAYPDASLVNEAVKAASGGEWNSYCRCLGGPVVVVEIRPDTDMFPGGMPNITALVKGRICMLPTGGFAYSENPVVHLYDYMRTALKVPHDWFNLPLLLAARNACDQQVVAYYRPVPVGQQGLPLPVYEPRYACHALLTSDATRKDNMRVLMSAASMTMTWAGGQFDVRAGVPHDISAVTLTDSDLASDGMTCTPEAGVMDSFNCVRGRFADAGQGYAITDFPPYTSPFYIEQDRGPDMPAGNEAWMEIDLPAVTSAYQAQRIAILQLRLSRNALVFRAHFKPVLAGISAGQIVNYTNEAFGFANKPFYVTQKQRRDDRSFDAVLTEAALALYDPSYDELTSPDPAPNTRLTPSDTVAALTGLTIASGPDYADYGTDGTVRAYAIASWDPAPAGVAYGGRIELVWQFGDYTESHPVLLPGNATSYRIDIQRDRQLVVRVRAINGIQVVGPWVSASHTAVDAPTDALTGNLLRNAEFLWHSQSVLPDAAYPNEGLYIPFWRGPEGTSPTGNPSFDGSHPYFEPIASVVEEPPGVYTSRYLGIAGWVDDEASSYPSQYVLSEVVAIEPGARLYGMFKHWSMWGRGRVGVLFYDADRRPYFTSLSDLAPPRDPTHNVGYNPAHFQQIGEFFDVPEWSAMCRLVLWDERQGGLPNSFVNQVNVMHPFLGYASAGQQTAPPWSK